MPSTPPAPESAMSCIRMKTWTMVRRSNAFRSNGKSSMRRNSLRPLATVPPAYRLCRLHRCLLPAYRLVPRQGCRMEHESSDRRLRGILGLARARRTFSVAGDWRHRLRRHFFKAHAIQFRRLGIARVGVLSEARRCQCARGRPVHQSPHHPSADQSVRRTYEGYHR